MCFIIHPKLFPQISKLSFHKLNVNLNLAIDECMNFIQLPNFIVSRFSMEQSCSTKKTNNLILQQKIFIVPVQYMSGEEIFIVLFVENNFSLLILSLHLGHSFET